MLVQQNTNNAMYVLNHLIHKTINAFCFNQSKHSALSAMCYFNQIKHCKTITMLHMNYIKHNSTSVFF